MTTRTKSMKAELTIRLDFTLDSHPSGTWVRNITSKQGPRLVVREGMTAGLTGIAISLASVAASRLIRALVFGLSVRDASTYLGVSILLAIVAFASCVVPAMRASRVDPMTALRLD